MIRLCTLFWLTRESIILQKSFFLCTRRAKHSFSNSKIFFMNEKTKHSAMLQTKHFIFLKKAYSNQDTLKKFPNLIYKLNFPVKLQRMGSDQLSKKFLFLSWMTSVVYTLECHSRNNLQKFKFETGSPRTRFEKIIPSRLKST